MRISGDLTVAGTVKLGGDDGTGGLVLSSFLGLYNGHTHPGTGAPPAQQASEAVYGTSRVEGK